MKIGDTESDSFKFESTVIWVMCFYDDVEDNYSVSFAGSVYKEFDVQALIDLEIGPKHTLYGTHEEHLKVLENSPICAHNLLQHDLPLIKRFYPWFNPQDMHDSYILSQLLNADRGQHGLAAWGERFGHPKPAHEEWHKFSPEMMHRVVEDVKINVKVWEALQKEQLGWDWSKAINIEYKVAELAGRQELHGVKLDIEKAYSLADEIYTEIQIVDEQLNKHMPMLIIPGTEIKAPFKMDGSLKIAVNKWYEDDVHMVSGPFCKVVFKQVNLNSPPQVKQVLLDNGWRPTSYTDKGSPQLTEDSYPSIKGDLGKLISRRAVLKHRGGIIFSINKQGGVKGWLNTVRDDGRVEAGAITCGTSTGRMQHRGVVNVPKPKDKLWDSGIQLRELLTVAEGFKMIGTDACGLEARVMASFIKKYPGGEEYAREILEGDIHTVNSKIFDTDRDGAKPPYYLLMYGGSAKGLAECLNISELKAKRVYARFWRESTALSAFKAKATEYWKSTGKKFVIGIDGRKIRIRSEHSIVNAIFQSSGSIMVKVAIMFLDKWIKEEGLDASQLIVMHDEVQLEVADKDVERVSYLSEEAFRASGRYFNFNVPMDGDAIVGMNWKETH